LHRASVPVTLKLTLPLIAALAGLKIGASFADDTAAQADDATRLAAAQRTFASLDHNRDGAISRAEAAEMKQLLVDFDRIDLDRDEKLELAEYASFYWAGYR
jgi:hypothetical protein